MENKIAVALLRLTTIFAGHKYPSATERYKQSGIEELKTGYSKTSSVGVKVVFLTIND